jgi:hypothetical protein
MKMGVSILPCGVVKEPSRAALLVSVLSTLKSIADKISLMNDITDGLSAKGI